MLEEGSVNNHQGRSVMLEKPKEMGFHMFIRNGVSLLQAVRCPLCLYGSVCAGDGQGMIPGEAARP